jgi:hypothetical protein
MAEALWTLDLPHSVATPVSFADAPPVHPTHGGWHVRASASEPIVALLLVACQGTVEWIKSSVGGEDGLLLRVAIHPQPSDNAHATVGAGNVLTHSFVRRGLDAQRITPVCEPLLTGQVRRLVVLGGEPRIEVGALLLVRGDVKFGRNRLWHAAPRCLDGTQQPLTSILSHGRTGSFDFQMPRVSTLR